MSIVLGILSESYVLLKTMSPYLLFGFLFAGVLHIFISPEMIARHLGKDNFLSVVKASLFGIPLPLCSCGVIPAAMSLRKEGASKGAILSFLISTPTTSVDSIFATYSLLGGVFAVYRIIASFFAGVFSGILANIFIRSDAPSPKKKEMECKLCDEHEEHAHTLAEKIKGVFTYAFGELLGDIGKWLLLGTLIGGGIAYFVPENFIQSHLGSGWQAILIMLVVGMPMYVCATGSIPIAAALMLKGMNPGAAFVFLMAGPATNAVSMTVISGNIGKKTLILYLFSIVFTSVTFGLLLDRIWDNFGVGGITQAMLHRGIVPAWLEITSSIILVGLILYSLLKGRQTRKGAA